jgi:hypothetical protein
MEYALLIGIPVVIAALGLGYAAYAARKSFVWSIKVRDGSSALIRGKIPLTAVGELTDVLNRNGVQNATIYGIKRRGMVMLVFSRSIPKSCHQGLRNVWAMHAR